MRYELLLQPPPGGTLDEAAVIAGLRGRHPVEEGPVRRWRLPKGELEVHLHLAGGQPAALELHVPLADKDELLRQAVHESAAVAEALGIVLYDPQLNRPVAPSDEEAVAAQFAKNARDVAEVVGVPGLTGLGVDPEPTGLKPGTKVMLGVFAFLFALLLLSDLLAKLALHSR